MSYAIVQKIRIDKDNKVFITSADNNVYPRTPQEWECTYFSNYPDRESIELDILAAYESGEFQAGRQNKYTRSLNVLRHLPEYKRFDWRNNWEESQKNRKNKAEFNSLLKKAFYTKLPKEKYAIIKDYLGKKVYFNRRRNSRTAYWYNEPSKATIFNYKEDAENTKKYFTGNENWEVVRY